MLLRPTKEEITICNSLLYLIVKHGEFENTELIFPIKNGKKYFQRTYAQQNVRTMVHVNYFTVQGSVTITDIVFESHNEEQKMLTGEQIYATSKISIIASIHG